LCFSAPANHFARPGPIGFSNEPFLVLIELEAFVSANPEDRYSPAQRAAHVQCAWDIYKKIAADAKVGTTGMNDSPTMRTQNALSSRVPRLALKVVCPGRRTMGAASGMHRCEQVDREGCTGRADGRRCRQLGGQAADHSIDPHM
jgi:hypothetical protein